MPPAKRTTATQTRRSKRLRTDLSEAGPSSVVENPPMPQQQKGQGGEIQGGQGAMQLDMRALTSTISVAVAQAVKDAMAAHQATVSSTVTPTPTPSVAIEQVVQNEVLSYTTGTIEQAPLSALLGVGDQPSHPFSSIAVLLGSRVSAKIKAKIWSNEYIDFGVLLSVAPPREKFALSMVSSEGAVNQPQLTLEPYHTPKKVANMSQWLTAFNTFV
ncbi:hypothetical protein ABFA07_005515 [Porites harrisoni]